MGYYSTFEVTVSPDIFDPDEIKAMIFALEDASGGYNFEEYNDAFHAEGKWYDHQSDMLGLSELQPEREFTVEQIGEDGDGSKYTVKAGKVTQTFVRGWVPAVE